MPQRRTLAFLVLLLAVPPLAAQSPHTFTEACHGKGTLRYIDGIPVLTVSGTPEEIGEQIGALTGKQLGQIARYPKMLVSLIRGQAGWDRLMATSKKLLPQFPEDYRKEMAAVAKAAHLDPELLLAGNTFPDILKSGGCSTIIVEPHRSVTRGPLFGRNLDYPSLGFLYNYTLVTVYHPKGKHSFVSVGFPGMLGCVSGMNDAGLSLATLEVYWSKDGAPRLDTSGIPYTLCYRRLLEECGTVAAAERLMRSMKRTTMNNLAVCDTHAGEVFELTSKSLVVRPPLDDLCLCTNHFRTAELAPTEKRFARLKQCWRYATLEQAAALPQLGLADVARKLDQVNQGSHTLQSMIFEPATLTLHLAAGRPPASALPMHTLDLGLLFRPK
ncbi:MAG TPA: C45 family peptidase [Gemmataceae bacterium]|nr:C45 family peptidase [Gemmataceae bacterium]